MESQLKSAAHRLRRVRPTISVGLSNLWSVDFADGNGQGLVSLIPLVRDSRGGLRGLGGRIEEHGIEEEEQEDGGRVLSLER